MVKRKKSVPRRKGIPKPQLKKKEKPKHLMRLQIREELTVPRLKAFIEEMEKKSKVAKRGIAKPKKAPIVYNYNELVKRFGGGQRGKKKAVVFMKLYDLEKRYKKFIDSITISTIDAGKKPHPTILETRADLITKLEEIRDKIKEML